MLEHKTASANTPGGFNARFPTRTLIAVLLFGICACSDDDGTLTPTGDPTLRLVTEPDASEGMPRTEYRFIPVSENIPHGVDYVWNFDDGSEERILADDARVQIKRFDSNGRYYVSLRLVSREYGHIVAEAGFEANIRDAVESVAMTLIPAGDFFMGSTISFTEEPVHSVSIPRPFYLGTYEVTQSQYRSLTGYSPSWFEGESLPVESVSWYDAVRYCNALSVREGFEEYYTISGKVVTVNTRSNGYRLPTEAEWEYACRSGTQTDLYSGNLLNPRGDCLPDQPEELNLDRVAWYCLNSDRRSHPVGSKEPNAFGLYDMHGNVCEWVGDYFEDGYYARSPRVNPQGPASGEFRIVRGGCHSFGIGLQRAARRFVDIFPEVSSNYFGFRVARNAP